MRIAPLLFAPRRGLLTTAPERLHRERYLEHNAHAASYVWKRLDAKVQAYAPTPLRSRHLAVLQLPVLSEHCAALQSW